MKAVEETAMSGYITVASIEQKKANINQSPARALTSTTQKAPFISLLSRPTYYFTAY